MLVFGSDPYFLLPNSSMKEMVVFLLLRLYVIIQNSATNITHHYRTSILTRKLLRSAHLAFVVVPVLSLMGELIC